MFPQGRLSNGWSQVTVLAVPSFISSYTYFLIIFSQVLRKLPVEKWLPTSIIHKIKCRNIWRLCLWQQDRKCGHDMTWHEDVCENLFQTALVSFVLCRHKRARWCHCLKESGTNLVNDSIAPRRRPRWLLALRHYIKILGNISLCCYISSRWHKLVIALDVTSVKCNRWSLKMNNFMKNFMFCWPCISVQSL